MGASSLDLPLMNPNPRRYLSGYINPILAHGEEKAIQSAKDAGANGFIVVDLPLEEAITFRDRCISVG